MKIAIIGGGISGLATAYYLQNDAEVTVFEKEIWGGKAHTIEKNGYLFEEGVNGFLNNSQETLDLCQEIGVKVIKANENAKIRYVYDDKLYLLPLKPPHFLKSDILSFRGKLRVAKEYFIKRAYLEDESVYDFALRRLGKEFTERLMRAMVAGIYASVPEKMSLSAAFPKIAALEKEYGGLFRAMIKKKRGGAPSGDLCSFDQGMSQFIKTLREKSAVTFVDKEIHSLSEVEGFDHIILATPTFEAAKIVKERYPKLSQKLSAFNYTPVAVVGFSGEIEPVSFGILTTKLATLGILFDKYIFPNRNGFRVMVGGERFDVRHLSQEEIIDMTRKDIETITGATKLQCEYFRLWSEAIPQYEVGHLKRVAEVQEALKECEGVSLNSNALKGVSFNDCISNAKKIAQSVINVYR